MDLAKFIWLLQTNKLYFPRLDQLQDPFEGSATQKTLEGVARFLEQHGQIDAKDDVRNIFKNSRASLFVNSWHASDYESEAMWKLYCHSGNGIAIQSSYKSLVNSINDAESFYIGQVSYVDYEQHSFKDVNVLGFAMHKRHSFAHEREIRLLSMGEQPNSGLGITLDWNPRKWVHATYVDPYAPDYYFDAVNAVIEKFAPSMSSNLRWSQMKTSPIY